METVIDFVPKETGWLAFERMLRVRKENTLRLFTEAKDEFNRIQGTNR